MRQVEFKIKVEAQFSMTKAELYRKLKNWLEHNGHTTPSHGFEIKELSNLGDNDD